MTKKSADTRSWLKAAEEGDLAKIKAMIDEGADLDAVNEHGWTAAMLATSQGHAHCLEALINAGCDVDAMSLGEENPILLAAIEEWRSECLGLLIEAGAQLDIRDKQGCTSALISCLWGNANCLDLLIKANCDIDARDHYGFSALDIALKRGHEACANRLRQAFAEREALAISANLNRPALRRRETL